MIAIRLMEIAELQGIAEIDRSERVTKIYVHRDGTLIPKDVDWNIQRWPLAIPSQQDLPQETNPKDTVPGQIAIWRPMLASGSIMFGAFDGDNLVGFSIYRPNLSQDTAQLAALFISKGYRGQRIGVLLVDKAVAMARADGAKKLYVSSTPTIKTVDFYMSRGFELTSEINEHLFKLEPEDIHLIKSL